jgi:hypothetical protein
MMSAQAKNRAALGFTVKSGWASVVLLDVPTGAGRTPRVVETRRVDLSDPATPDAKQPYHAGFGTARSAGRELSNLVASVKKFGRRSVTAMIADYRKRGHDIQRAGVVVGSLIDPAAIANDHIRIHALEGRLFREVVQEAAGRNGIACAVWRERDLYGAAAELLEQSEASIRDQLAQIGEAVDGSWRAEQKLAALAAWLVLSRRR